MSRTPIRASARAGLALIALWTPVALAAQEPLRWEDLVITTGTSVESYQGNLTAITVPVVDSTDRASAFVAEVAARGDVVVRDTERRTVRLGFDVGVRQFLASGFEIRSYSPREMVGEVGVDLRERVEGWGELHADAAVRARSVNDRPPMPMFLQPGYVTARGGVRFLFEEMQGLRFDVAVEGEVADYLAAPALPQLDLLDRRSARLEAGAEWGRRWRVRFFGAHRWSHYPSQGSFDPGDPYRRDGAVEAGAQVSLISSSLIARVGLGAVLNRSNSRRPEYDAYRLRALLSAPLPGDFDLNLFAVLTDKSYLTETDFARLVPGEEADNASQVYVYLTRALSTTMDGGIRLGWTRAETDIGAAYFRRYGATFLVHWRPMGR